MKNNKISVLIFPSEGMNAIELHDALSSCVNIKVFGTSSVDRHGRYVFRNYIGGIPNIMEPNFLEFFNKILIENRIDLIFPTHDSVAKYLVENENSLRAKLISGDYFTTDICRSKIKTYEFFKQYSFMPLRIYTLDKNLPFPLFSKPDQSQGAVGARIINSVDDLLEFDFEENLLTEFLPGEEYTVDCFTDKNGNLRYISPRTRDRMLAGMSVAGKTIVVTKEIEYIAQIINKRLNFLGLWYFQLKADRNRALKLMEISTRCAGTMCLTRSLGINLPMLSVYTAMGYDIEITSNSYCVEMERILVGMYKIDYTYQTVYIDFDDTITLNGKVNQNVMRYLYQCRNQGKKIILITKHEKKIESTLNYYAISNILFNEIISIKENDRKTEYINPQNAIFIDNSYLERVSVAMAYNIPVFDVEGIEFLLDWRT